MKIVKLALFVLLVATAWLAWTRLPGLRTKVGATIDEYGGWTAEARAADPVGFLDFAEAKLTRDIETFKRSRETLASTIANAQMEQARTETLRAAAVALAARFREAYHAVGDDWPVEVEGATYERDQLLEQVDALLRERDTYGRVVETYASVIESAGAQRTELLARIQTTEATLIEVRAQRELVRVKKATAETDELLAQIDALVSGNNATSAALDDPVRTVEDLLAAESKSPSDSASESASRALEFLTE